jgi:hypothetical protein
MSEISGITDFLDQAGTKFSVFDMGRRIEEIPRDDFLAFEQGEIAYPLPLQQQAWLGFVVWNEKENDELVVWFLRFPLDATGKLTAGIRDDFVLRLINRDQAEQDDESNPYGFKPKQEHMACFHAKAAKLLGKPASSYYEHARDYFAGKPGYDQWAFVGFQGIADVCARLDESDNAALLPAAIGQMPPQPFEALAQCLEHEAVDEQITRAVVALIEQELAKDSCNANFISLCIRAISNTQQRELLTQQLQQILQSACGSNPEVLASISGRSWLALQNPDTIALFLEALANCSEGQTFFNLVIVDLINIPGMQDSIHLAIRNTGRSEKLSQAIGELFKSFT